MARRVGLQSGLSLVILFVLRAESRDNASCAHPPEGKDAVYPYLLGKTRRFYRCSVDTPCWSRPWLSCSRRCEGSIARDTRLRLPDGEGGRGGGGKNGTNLD